MVIRRNLSRLMAVLILAALVLVFETTAQADDGELTSYTFDELNEMELKANTARQEFWIGNYENALGIFQSINEMNHASSALYDREIGTCYLNMGNYEKAKDHFLRAVRFGEFFQSQELEEQALSNYGQEEEKIYKGDPYEQALAYMMMAMFFMGSGDYDNALAACKSGLMADSDTTENRYESDLTLLHLLEAKCHILRGNPETAEQIFSKAMDSYRITSEGVRDIYSERLSQISILKLSPAEKKEMKIKESEEDINNKLLELDEKFKQAIKSIEVDNNLGLLLTGQYNTLIVVPRGKGPEKMRAGKSGSMVIFDNCSSIDQGSEVFLNGSSIDNTAVPVRDIADVNFQANTRGGRRMDAILNGQAAFRDTTVQTGAFITELGNNVGGLGGLAVALIGAAVQGVGGAISPEADTRCWRTLPSYFSIYALDLPLGEHEVTFRQNVYFEKKNEVKRRIVIGPENDMAVVFGPSSLMGMYPEQTVSAGKARKRKKKQPAAPPLVLVTPPMGFQVIERFPALNENEKPEAFAPDPKKMMRTISKILKKRNFRNIQVAHNDCVSKKDEFAVKVPLALQVQLVKLGCGENENGDIEYKITMSYALIDTKSGARIFDSQVDGVSVKSKDEPQCTKAFYNCLKSASDIFASQPEFTDAVNLAAKRKEVPVASN